MRVAIAVFALALIACASAQTPGEAFRTAILQRKALCEKQAMSPGESTCRILALKPAEPLATAEGRFAYSINLPPPWDSSKVIHRKGMGSEEYFRSLCEQEAGEFIASRITDVEGIVQLRPRAVASYEMQQHLYALEDPYGYRDWEAREPEYFFVGPGKYRFFEKPIPGQDGQVARFFGYDGRNVASMKSEIAAKPRSRYGFVWRGISRPQDRELGIAGGEYIVLDMQTGGVLAVKRGFARTGDFHISPGVWWPAAAVCPGDSKGIFALGTFVTRVLVPIKR